MSAFHDRPGDFVMWLERHGGCDGAPWRERSFVPRRLFGAYVRHLLNAEVKSGAAGRLELMQGEVIAIAEGPRLMLAPDRGQRRAPRARRRDLPAPLRRGPAHEGAFWR
jgi:uncharacterized NAD(P)/FAD-binding protein YdhS